MRILAVRGKNLASLAEPFAVNFTEGPLAAAGVFAIVGPTGAGKSTLLDAICVALFDRTPRLAGRSAVLIGQGSDDLLKLGASDVRTLLRRGASDGMAEVDFEGVDGRRYRATWTVWRARRGASGRLQEQRLSLRCLDTGAQLGGTKTETLQQIHAVLGLSFDQFCRSALLAQGDFAAFLRADAAERADLLERMTGTEIYGKVSELAYRRASQWEAELRELGGRVDALSRLSDDQRAVLGAEVSAAQVALIADRARLDLLRRWHAHGAEQVRLRADWEAAVAEQAGVEQEWLAAASIRDRLARAARLEPVRASFETWQRCVVEVERMTMEADAAAQGAWVAAHSAEGARLRASERRAQLARFGEEWQPLRPSQGSQLPSEVSPPRGDEDVVARVAEALQWLSHRPMLAHPAVSLSRLEAIMTRKTELERERAGREELAGQMRQRLADDEQRAAATRDERQAARNQLGEAEVNLDKTLASQRQTGEEARLGLRQVEQELDHAQRLVVVQHQVTAALEDRRRHEAEAVEQKDRAEQQLRRQAGLDDDVGQQRAALKEAGAAHERIIAMASLSHHRSQLEPGMPCPLCGATEHPGVVGGAVDELAARQGERVSELQAALERASAQLATCQRDHEAATAAQVAAVTAAAGAASGQSALAQEFSRSLEVSGELPFESDPCTESARIWCEAHRDRLVARRELAIVAGRDADAIEAAIREAQSRMLTTRDHIESLTRTLDAMATAMLGQREQLNEVDRELLRLATQREELGAAWTAAAGSWSPVQHAFDGDPAAWRAVETALQEWMQRAALVEGGITALEREAADREAESRLTEIESVRLGAAAQELQQQARVRTAERDVAHGALIDALTSLQETLLAAEELWRRPVDWDARDRRHLAELDDRRTTVRVRSADREARLVAHQAAPPAAPSGDEDVAIFEERISGHERTVAVAQERLRADDLARARHAELGQQMQAVEDRARPDRILSTLLGSHDGKVFRTFAQGLTLDALLVVANHHLQLLSPRFLLGRVPGYSLELQVVDRDLGDEVRSVSSLSGGESFLVSMALALALSSISTRGVRVKTLLIDEGFGSLDPETLDTALSVLDALQSTGCQVGIISHVPGLGERLPATVCLRPMGGGRSRITVQAAG
jgi:exonuclease SbcC